MICKCYMVSGRVQGVFFRGSTREQALKLGVVGYAKNLPNGNMEVIACANKARSLELLYQWLCDGPKMAVVDQVQLLELKSCQTYTDFDVY